MTQVAPAAEIFCDESGHDGENLMAGSTPVLAHSSLHMVLAEATDLVDYLRKKTRAQSPELKASAVLRGGDTVLEELFGTQGKLVSNVQVYLVEKAHFAVGKVIDLLLEEATYEAGINLYEDGYAKHLADTLYEFGPGALGADEWLSFVAAFTSLMREKQRKGGEKETADGFFEKIDHARTQSTHQRVTFILTLLTATRRHADEFQSDMANGTLSKQLDPLQASLFQLALTWSSKLQLPIRVMHDAQNGLTEHVMSALMMAANEEMPKEFNLPDNRFQLVEIKHIDSKADPRIQLADIAAGFTRQVAESALKGTAENKRLAQVQRLVHFNSIWGDRKSWEQIRPRD